MFKDTEGKINKIKNRKFDPNRLIELRLEKELTREEAAFQIGIAASSLQNYENGRLYPGKINRDRICTFYNKSLNVLFPDRFKRKK